MNRYKEISEDDINNNDVDKVISCIFAISIMIIIIFNLLYFNTFGPKFNTTNFLSLLPFNLIGLSITLYLVMVITYNLA